MPELHFARTVQFTVDQMMDLVADVTKYPEFVPNCEDMRISPVKHQHHQVCDATMSVAFGPVTGSYTSRVTVDKSKNTVSAVALDGPFSHLDSQWRFEAIEQGTSVTFDLDFAFSNRLFSAIAEPIFANKQEDVINAFFRRAAQLYG